MGHVHTHEPPIASPWGPIKYVVLKISNSSPSPPSELKGVPQGFSVLSSPASDTSALC